VLLRSTIIIFVGIIDDIKHLPAILKLVAQLVACFVLIGFGIEISISKSVILNRLLTVFGVLGITNAVNFLDNMDGLAAGISAICAATIFIIAYNTQQIWLGYLALALCFACLGFLPFNFKPAKIFMGDSGSTFLGFTLAALAIMGSWSFKYSVMTALAVPVLILGVFIFDTTLITVLRVKDGKVHNFMEWIGHVDTDHFSHRLVALGLSQRQAVTFIYFCAMGLGPLAVFVQHVDKTIVSFAVALIILALAFLGGKILDGVKPYTSS
jgi:UDP-GlcNAc:undecaprenyl-phosphate GlcNAc-1-phosphate transferase